MLTGHTKLSITVSKNGLSQRTALARDLMFTEPDIQIQTGRVPRMVIGILLFDRNRRPHDGKSSGSK
jgi:hypothetical protein